MEWNYWLIVVVCKFFNTTCLHYSSYKKKLSSLLLRSALTLRIDLDTQLAKVLFHYRITPHATTWLPGTVVRMQGTTDLWHRARRWQDCYKSCWQSPQAIPSTHFYVQSDLAPHKEDDCLPIPAASSGCSTETHTTDSAGVPLQCSTRVTHPPNKYT